MKRIITIAVIIAGITLVAFTLYSNKQELEQEAKLAEETSDFIPVVIEKVQRKELGQTSSPSGTFQAKSDLSMLSETQGQVVKLYKEKGDRVKKEEVIAQVENELLKAETEAAKVNYERLQSDFKRFTDLAGKKAVTERQLEEVTSGFRSAEAQYKSAKKRLEDTYIKAPVSGIIHEDYIQEGSFVSPGARLYDIVDISQLKLNVSLLAHEIIQVETGDKVKITTELYPDKEYTGKITAIANKADNALKYNTEITLDNNSDKPLKAGMYATAHFALSQKATGLFISRTALAGSIKDPKVFVYKNNKSQLKNIKIGQIYQDEIEIIDGLTEGEQVIVNGQINLQDGTPVKPIE